MQGGNVVMRLTQSMQVEQSHASQQSVNAMQASRLLFQLTAVIWRARAHTLPRLALPLNGGMSALVNAVDRLQHRGAQHTGPVQRSRRTLVLRLLRLLGLLRLRHLLSWRQGARGCSRVRH